MISIPEPETVLSDLSHLFPVVNSALQHGTFKALDYFEQMEPGFKGIDPYLASSLVRFHAKEILKKSGQKIVNVDHLLNIQNVPNIGIYLCSGRYNIRILKSKNGEIPAPGHSATRQAFYCQIQSQMCFDFFEDENGRINLLVLWDVTKPYNLHNITLACPKTGGETRGSVFVYWQCPIPQEILIGHTTSASNVSDDIEDLPISRNVIIETEAEK